jgi:hypothetical protein
MNNTDTMMSTRFQSLKILTFILATGLSSGQAVAQSSATADAAVLATILTPITIEKVAGAGTVALTPTSATVRTVTGDVQVVGIGFTAAAFTIGGAAGATYTLTLPTTAVLTHTDNATMTMEVSPITRNLTASNTFDTTTGNTQNLYLGGVLRVAAAQSAGNYSGNITVTVDYN